MPTTTLMRKQRTPLGLEVRYERSFLVDLKRLPSAAFEQIRQFVFEEFYEINQLHELSEFRQIHASGIFYRFTCDRYLISLEITGQIVKFLRVLPKPGKYTNSTRQKL